MYIGNNCNMSTGISILYVQYILSVSANQYAARKKLGGRATIG